MPRAFSGFAFGLVALVATVSPSAALQNRTTVSNSGTDTGTCAITAPCRTFSYAFSQTSSNGQILVLDSGGYGTLTIDRPVSIINDSNSAIVNVTSGAGITITAGTSDKVTLKGLTLEGLGTGQDGVVINSAGTVTILNTTARNFLHNGITFALTSGSLKFTISDIVMTNIGNVGINYSPTTGSASIKGVIDRAHITDAGNAGIYVNTINATASIDIVGSIINNNNNGVYVYGGYGSAPVSVSIDQSTVVGNSGTGISGVNYVLIFLSRSFIRGNGTGLYNNATVDRFYTYHDNRINGNSVDTAGGSFTTLPTQ